MTRPDLLAHALTVLDELATEAGVSLSDDALGIAGQLDAALRDLGGDLGNVAAGEALIEYHVLRRLRYAVAARVDFDATAVKRNRSQIYHQVTDLLNDAAARAAAEDEIGFARSLCDHPPGTVLAMARRHDGDGAVREQFRTLHRREGGADRTRLPVFAAVSEEGAEEEPVRPDLAALARGAG